MRERERERERDLGFGLKEAPRIQAVNHVVDFVICKRIKQIVSEVANIYDWFSTLINLSANFMHGLYLT
jgi:hypothetical protein